MKKKFFFQVLTQLRGANIVSSAATPPPLAPSGYVPAPNLLKQSDKAERSVLSINRPH